MQRFLPGHKLATKSADGRMYVWNLPSMESVAAWKVPGCTPMGGLASRCLFNATSDGKYIAAVRGGDIEENKNKSLGEINNNHKIEKIKIKNSLT